MPTWSALTNRRDLDRLATFVLTTMEGAVMQSRTRRSLVPFDQSVEALRGYVEILIGGSVADLAPTR